MKTRAEKMYDFPIFNQMEGLAEEVVRFEAQTGMSLPDIFSYTFMQVFTTEESTMVIGKMGAFFIVALETNGKTHYELHENKVSFRLWASELFHDLKEKQTNATLTEEEKRYLKENRDLFFEKIDKLCEED